MTIPTANNLQLRWNFHKSHIFISYFVSFTLLLIFARVYASDDNSSSENTQLLPHAYANFFFDFESGPSGWRFVKQRDTNNESASKDTNFKVKLPPPPSHQQSNDSKLHEEGSNRVDDIGAPPVCDLPPSAMSSYATQVERDQELAQRKDSAPSGRALRIDVSFPQETCIRLKKRISWSGYNQMFLDIFLAPPDKSKERRDKRQLLMKAIAYVKDSELLWYDSYQEIVLMPGKWNFISFDISDNSNQWHFKGHRKPWDGYTKQDIQEVGFKFFSDTPFKGSIYIDNIRLSRTAWSKQSREGMEIAASSVEDRLNSEVSPPTAAPYTQTSSIVNRIKTRILGFRVNSPVVGQYEKFEITFNVNKVYSNPYDPEIVDIKAHFISPSGKITTVPAFFYQDYIRDKKRGAETLTPVGESEWKIRFAPQEIGAYRYSIEINERESETENPVLKTQPQIFNSVPSDNKGYIRISSKDRNYLEFDNGDFFYPIGHNICAPYDVRNAEILGITVMYNEGTFAYDKFLDAMSKNGENVGRVWMTSWSLGIEWTKKYDCHYNDLGRYNLERAWKLDHVIETAEEKGIYLSLTLSTFGHFKVGFEGDWPYNPYNTDNGGFLPVPEAFFTYPEAEKYFKRRLRYIMARWGYSTAIMSWEIFNEIDLADGVRYGRDEKVVNWHRKMLRYIKQIDQGKHLVSSSILYWRQGKPFWSLDEMEYVNAHIFDVELVEAFRGYYNATAQYNKPRFVTEAGSTVWGRSPEVTENYIHIALWASYMMPFPGSAMPWWWLFIDSKNLYFHFKALSNFAKGEDRRGKRLNFGRETVSIVTQGNQAEIIKRLGVECLRNESLAYLWVYDKMLLNPSVERKEPPPQNGAIKLEEMKPGKYMIEFWDTYKGEIINSNNIVTEDGSMILPLPPIDKDLACKVKLVN